MASGEGGRPLEGKGPEGTVFVKLSQVERLLMTDG